MTKTEDVTLSTMQKKYVMREKQFRQINTVDYW